MWPQEKNLNTCIFLFSIRHDHHFLGTSWLCPCDIICLPVRTSCVCAPNCSCHCPIWGCAIDVICSLPSPPSCLFWKVSQALYHFLLKAWTGHDPEKSSYFQLERPSCILGTVPSITPPDILGLLYSDCTRTGKWRASLDSLQHVGL